MTSQMKNRMTANTTILKATAKKRKEVRKVRSVINKDRATQEMQISRKMERMGRSKEIRKLRMVHLDRRWKNRLMNQVLPTRSIPKELVAIRNVAKAEEIN